MSPPDDFQESPGFPDFTDSSRTRKAIYSVSELTGKIKNLIEDNFPFVWVRGEISNFRMPSSGHFYFTLKDESAQIAAVMFRPQNRQIKFVPEDGLNIIGLGRLSVYEPRGSYQIILEYVEPAGVGALQIAFERLKQRLADKGYFDERRKKPIPYLPRKIAVITSPSGAVVHDIITVISRRFPNVQLEIVPARVQGGGAEDDIVGALERVNARADSDVIILARGGGSLEDLQAFNSEPVAMAIFASRIPVISAVGHETDVTIADFIADLRAPTPSAAAEMVVPEKSELLRRLHDLEQSLRSGLKRHLEQRSQNIDELKRRLVDPRRRVQELWLRIDDFSSRLNRSAASCVRRENDRLGVWVQRLNSNSPRTLVQKIKSKLHADKYNLLTNINIIVMKKGSIAGQAKIRLESLNPLSILQRGYSVTRSLPGRKVVSHPDQVSLDQQVEILLADGQLLCNVKGKTHHGQENV
jgi:exodeoxyribonuclease VII large subunit